jgi:hypothetical protein
MEREDWRARRGALPILSERRLAIQNVAFETIRIFDLVPQRFSASNVAIVPD